VVATVGVYLPALPGQFLWDDDSWTTKIEPLLRDVSGLGRMWREPGAVQGYPLTATTFWLDHHLWGQWTLPYHLENVLLHAAAALLLARLLQRLGVPGAWLAAAIFALHPVMAESVAWITERKNVLAQVFFLAALLAFGRANGFWSTGPKKWKRSDYGMALLLFAAGLLSKITVSVLPPVILLLAWWKRGRLHWKDDVLPVLPFLVLTLGFGPLAMGLENPADWTLTWPQRILVAGRVVIFYAGKLLWPDSLAFFYPRWNPEPGSWIQWLCPIAVLTILTSLWLARRQIGRGPVAALLYFVGTLVPVLGVLDVYSMRYSFVADRWVYLSSLGLIALVAAAVVRQAERWREPALEVAFAAVILPMLTFTTWQQAGQYRDLETLWRTTIERNPAAWLAQHNLGVLLLDRGDLGDSVIYLRKAIALRPSYPEAHYNLGTALLRQGRVAEAIPAFEQAILLRGNHAEAQNSLGFAHFLLGDIGVAIVHYHRALAIRPDFAAAHANLGNALLRQADPKAAREHFEAAIRSADPPWTALNGLAMLLATAPEEAARDGSRALLLAEEARRRTGGRELAVLHTLAAAHAELGDFATAIKVAEVALRLAKSQGQRPIAEALRQALALYRAAQPIRDRPPP
jgi:tetratricopeptide (TPR) repeat protein